MIIFANILNAKRSNFIKNILLHFMQQNVENTLTSDKPEFI